MNFLHFETKPKNFTQTGLAFIRNHFKHRMRKLVEETSVSVNCSQLVQFVDLPRLSGGLYRDSVFLNAPGTNWPICWELTQDFIICFRSNLIFQLFVKQRSGFCIQIHDLLLNYQATLEPKPGMSATFFKMIFCFVF